MSMTSIKPNWKMSAFCVWSWTPTGKPGYLASGRDKKDKRLSPKNRLWCRMRLWDSEWPRNWGLDWEGEGWWLCLMLADLFLTENYNLFQLGLHLTFMKRSLLLLNASQFHTGPQWCQSMQNIKIYDTKYKLPDVQHHSLCCQITLAVCCS